MVTQAEVTLRLRVESFEDAVKRFFGHRRAWREADLGRALAEPDPAFFTLIKPRVAHEIAHALSGICEGSEGEHERGGLGRRKSKV